MWIELIILFSVLILFVYRWGTKNFDFFEKRNVAADKPFFFLGSTKDIIFGKKSVFHHFCDLYNRHDGMVYGTFDLRQPILLIRDPQLIKHIMIKDFDHFTNRLNNINGNGGNENFLSDSLFFMQNEKWRYMRNTLSPAFTGSKMRQMFKLILLEIDESMDYLKNKINDNNCGENGLEVDVKDFSSRLSVNIIASTAFGFQINSFKDEKNEFFLKAKKAIQFTAIQQIKMFMLELFPRFARIFKISLFDKDFTDYFNRLVLNAMKYRAEHNIYRPDMINLLMEARGMISTDIKKSHFQEWSDIEVVAQCFLFFFAGMEPLSTAMCFCIQELMEYPRIQNKLFEEIQQISDELESNSISYEILQKMVYMDKFVSEILRKWPVTLVADRLCNKDFIYEANGKRLEIKKGDVIRIPMCGIHRDPQYYYNPEVIDPERFNDDNKSKIDSGRYLPFGLGPRSCIANRFALMEIKAFLFHLIRDYRLEASSKTTLPLELKKTGFNLIPENGFWVQFVPRK